ncbi:MAG: hypothetical protein JST16_11630 [Bdellovibrionales bacterium]|nr:hypothetical protein [Bdellovibrionales bacterium]
MILTFRNEIEASIYAEKHKPLRTALNTPPTFEYARRYGQRASDAVNDGRWALRAGDMVRATLHARSLSTILFHERPDLFEMRERRAA